MENKYLDKMLTQPDYVVVYDENKGFYHGNTLNKEDYKKLQYDMFIHNTKVKMLVGYAASKSHPNTPVKIYISLDMINSKCERLEHGYIKAYKSNIDGILPYEGKHDLFIYSDYNMAILAGKEMAFMDSIDEYVETVGSKVKEYFPDTKFNRNFDFKWLQDKFNIYKNRGYFDNIKQQVNDVFEKKFGSSTETVKNTVNNATDYVKSSIERFLDELNKVNEDLKQPSKDKDFAKNEDFALYKQLTDEYAVLLKHRKRNGKSRYTVNIINLTLDINKTHDITFEQFCDIYEILNEDADGQLKVNSIADILPKQIFEEKPIEVVKEKPKKTNPIQFCQFRAEDEIPSKPRSSKAKFKIGDLVYIKSMGINGRIAEILDARANTGKTRKLYKVVYGVSEHKYGVIKHKSFWSYELEKA